MIKSNNSNILQLGLVPSPSERRDEKIPSSPKRLPGRPRKVHRLRFGLRLWTGRLTGEETKIVNRRLKYQKGKCVGCPSIKGRLHILWTVYRQPKAMNWRNIELVCDRCLGMVCKRCKKIVPKLGRKFCSSSCAGKWQAKLKKLRKFWAAYPIHRTG